MANIEDLLLILKEPHSLAAESYRGVRTSLQRALANDVKTIMFVSCYAGDGKSMLCANVAVALTQLFQDVVLVDGDLRRPTLTNLFDAVDHPGLGDYLAGSATLEAVLMATQVERLRLVPAGNNTENAGNLLGRPAVTTFCKEVSAVADAVIFDTSPISACNDALSLGQHVDTTVMVISPRRWDGDVEIKVRQALEQHNVPLMGVVLNGTAPSAGSYASYAYGGGQARYGYEGYGYGYGYGDERSGRAARKKKTIWQSIQGLFGPE